MSCLSIQSVEPLEISGPRAEREARARQLMVSFVKFLGDHVDLLVQVRTDFLEKPKHETIMGCHTFGEYCRNVLHYSESHIRRLIAGRNPATAIHDGSMNRLPAPEPEMTAVERLHDCGFVERCRSYDPVLLGLVLAQAMLIDSGTEEDLIGAAGLEGKVVRHICRDLYEHEDIEAGLTMRERL